MISVQILTNASFLYTDSYVKVKFNISNALRMLTVNVALKYENS